MSKNYGASFTQVDTIANTGPIPAPGWFQTLPRAVFGKAGEFWVNSMNLYRYTNAGATKTQIANITAALGVGFGISARRTPGRPTRRPLPDRDCQWDLRFLPLRRRVGATWTRINDANHQYGNAMGIEGDETIYGRAYVGAGGRGIL